MIKNLKTEKSKRELMNAKWLELILSTDLIP